MVTIRDNDTIAAKDLVLPAILCAATFFTGLVLAIVLGLRGTTILKVYYQGALFPAAVALMLWCVIPFWRAPEYRAYAPSKAARMMLAKRWPLLIFPLLLPAEAAAAGRAAFTQLAAGTVPSRYETDWVIRDGQLRHLAFVTTGLPDRTGRVAHLVTAGIDLTEQRRTQHLMVAVLAATTEQALIATDRHGRIIVFNAGAERMLGHTAEQALGRDVAELLHQPDELARRADALGVPVESVVAFRAQNGIAHTQHWDYRRRDGSTVPVALSVTALRHPTGELQGYLGVAVDVTDQQQREQQLHQAAEHATYQAAHDPLTGLPNRAVLIDRLTHTLAEQRRHHQPTGGLLYLDVDGLKTINDVHGHGAGDALLVAVARRLTAACREGDLCARLGGDEFAVLLEDVHEAAELDNASDRIRQHMAEPLPLDPDAVVIPSASIGGTLLRSTDTPEAALARADRHMYTHKPAHPSQGLRADPRPEDLRSPSTPIDQALDP